MNCWSGEAVAWGTAPANAASARAAPTRERFKVARMLDSLEGMLKAQRPLSQTVTHVVQQTNQPLGFLDQEHDDQHAKDDLLQVLQLPRIHRAAEQGLPGMAEENRQQADKRRADEVAGNAAHAADNDDEQDLERAVDIKAAGAGRAQVSERPQRTGNAQVERTDGERQALVAHHRDTDHG